jgi:alkanesulfonate monooxygenase SsuD/methylene tetrahydromethanopterin reductase-like flavin-dependent oxidoreductase (luciferase family)
VGWNPPEYAALGAKFADRSDMLEEQVVLLRKFWTEPVVSFTGRFHVVESAGIHVLPARPIPLWIGGDGPRTLDRIGRLGDGWVPPGRVQPGEGAARCLAAIRSAAESAGRDPEAIGVEARLFARGDQSADEIREFIASWRPHGLTHLCVDTRLADGADSVATHVKLMRQVSPDML